MDGARIMKQHLFRLRQVKTDSDSPQSYRASCASRASRKLLYQFLASPKDDESRRLESRSESFQSRRARNSRRPRRSRPSTRHCPRALLRSGLRLHDYPAHGAPHPRSPPARHRSAPTRLRRELLDVRGLRLAHQLSPTEPNPAPPPTSPADGRVGGCARPSSISPARCWPSRPVRRAEVRPNTGPGVPPCWCSSSRRI